jgi:hypothetical protein
MSEQRSRTAHLAVDLRDEPRLGSHCFGALPDTLLEPEPVGQRRDDRITGGAVARVEWSDHVWTIPLRISTSPSGLPTESAYVWLPEERRSRAIQLLSDAELRMRETLKTM